MMLLFLRALVILLMLSCAYAEESGERRVVMVQNEEGNIRSVVDLVVEKCEERDLNGFLSCFTKSKRASMRKDAKKLFSEHVFGIKILSCETVNVEGKSATLRVQYLWNFERNSPVRIESDLALRMEDGSWLVHSEKIIRAYASSTHQELTFNFGGGGDAMIPQVNFIDDEGPADIGRDAMIPQVNFIDDEGPADIGRHGFGRCNNGMCQKPRPELPPNPAPVLDDEGPADIGRHEFGRCNNGRCKKPRPEPPPNPVPAFLDPNLPADIGQHPPIECKDGVCIVK